MLKLLWIAPVAMLVLAFVAAFVSVKNESSSSLNDDGHF